MSKSSYFAIVLWEYCSKGFSTNEDEDSRHKNASWRLNGQSVKNGGGSNWGENRATYWTSVHLPEGEDVSRWMLRHQEESDMKEGCQIWSQVWRTLCTAFTNVAHQMWCLPKDESKVDEWCARGSSYPSKVTVAYDWDWLHWTNQSKSWWWESLYPSPEWLLHQMHLFSGSTTGTAYVCACAMCNGTWNLNAQLTYTVCNFCSLRPTDWTNALIKLCRTC